jgi:glycosyltransferase involved in cell wall biosynthesis
MNEILLSIILPCYRENLRLPAYLEDLLITFKNEKTVEWILVDDGTPSLEFESLRIKIAHLLTGKNLTQHRYEKNTGKGEAIRFGIERSQGHYVGFVDADGSTPAAEVFRIWQYLQSRPEVDLVSGSRIVMLGRVVKKSLTRHSMNRIFATIFTWIYGIRMYDPQCGCKFFKRTKYESIKNSITNFRWLWDTQLTILFYRKGYHIQEFPIDWQERSGSKVNLLVDSITMFFALFQSRNIGR